MSFKSVKDSYILEIEKIIKTGRVLIEISDRYSYSFDASFGSYLPDIVIQTKSTEELAALVKFANQIYDAVLFAST